MFRVKQKVITQFSRRIALISRSGQISIHRSPRLKSSRKQFCVGRKRERTSKEGGMLSIWSWHFSCPRERGPGCFASLEIDELV